MPSARLDRSRRERGCWSVPAGRFPPRPADRTGDVGLRPKDGSLPPASQYGGDQIELEITAEELFRTIFNRHYRSVYNLFRRRGFSREESMDLTQDTFLRVYKSMGRFGGLGSQEGWILTIATNVWKNEIRKRRAAMRRAQEVSLDDPGRRDPTAFLDRRAAREFENPGALETLLTEEKIDLVDQALQTLAPQMKRCFLLRFNQNLRYREIAELMQVSVETVKSHIYQAKLRLREEIERALGRNG